MPAEENTRTLMRYRCYGLWVGLFLGVVAGIVVSGSQYREVDSPANTWVVIILLSAAVGALVGYVFFGYLAPSNIRGTYGSDGGWGGGDTGDYGGHDVGGDGDGGGH